jgi:hypothetical protein
MYANKEKQREANREKARRHRERGKGVTEGVTKTEGVTVAPKAKGLGVTDITEPKTPEELKGMTYEEHNRRSWALAAKMKREEPERFSAIVYPIVRDGFGDSIRWGCYGPTYTELWARVQK